MPEPAVVTAMREFKAGLLRREAAQMQEMARRWLDVEAALMGEIEALAYAFDARREAGETISQAALYRMERYKRLLGQTRDEFRSYARWSEGRIRDEQAQLGALGLEQAAQAIELSFWDGPGVAPRFDRLPVEAIEHMVGIAGNGRPLGELLRRRVDPSTGEWGLLVEALVRATALGQNPRDTAREMAAGLSGGLQKALVIARTEQLRVYRQASVDQYKASGVVSGQRRLAAHDARTCAACIADEGTLYGIDAVIADHPQGRCTGVPVVVGLPDVEWLSGEAWFRQQPRETQASILGNGRLEAWEGGAFEFGDLVTRTSDPTWGDGIVPTPLGQLLDGDSGDGSPPAGGDDGDGDGWLDIVESLDEEDYGYGPRPVPESERRAEAELADARAVYEAMQAAGDEAGAEGVRMYMDSLEEILAQEREVNEALWETLGMEPGEAGPDDWRIVAEALERESRELYKRYTRRGIESRVSKERAAQYSGWMSVGKDVIRVREGRFSRRTAQRMEADLWREAKRDLREEAGVFLQQLGFAEDEIAWANYEQRLRLLDEIGEKGILRTKSGRVARIDQVDVEVRRRVVDGVDYDKAAIAGNAAIDPLSLPTLGAYRKMNLAEYIMETRGGMK